MFGRRFYVSVCLGIGCVLLLGFGLAALRPDQIGQTAAGWAQALGAIGAIGVAIWIANSQHLQAAKTARAQRFAERESLFRTAITVGHTAHAELEALEGDHDFIVTYEPNAKIATRVRHLEWLRSRIEQFPLQGFGDDNAVASVIRLRSVLARFHDEVVCAKDLHVTELNFSGTLTAVKNATVNLERILALLSEEHARAAVQRPNDPVTSSVHG
ncbi:hypothetical protein N5J06_20115 [Ralstonia sp. CHL-2022]|uniref:Uncharacterized protein n=1 Tax=Ralstonia mojiangensis TaxID=2953895 RepID=A0ABT2LD18_9RALS|nr:hypothetical protein [Ralstonia mojiangensis]MCT7313286.1 hypothetical protein [Ralstonia mojiangensis]